MGRLHRFGCDAPILMANGFSAMSRLAPQRFNRIAGVSARRSYN
jgi:hypothetical protein